MHSGTRTRRSRPLRLQHLGATGLFDHVEVGARAEDGALGPRVGAGHPDPNVGIAAQTDGQRPRRSISKLSRRRPWELARVHRGSRSGSGRLEAAVSIVDWSVQLVTNPGRPVVKRTRFAEYKDSYANYKFELSEEGILFMQGHTDGGPLHWEWSSHDGMADAFADVAGDREIRVVIHTGTGETYNHSWGRPVTDSGAPLYAAYADAEGVAIMDEKAWYGRMLLENLLAIDVPMIAAVNGPCSMHSEVPLLMDIVLASEDAWFQDLSHFPRGMVPGDGQHVVWDALVGPSRARYLLLMGYKLTAGEAREWGVVHEVLARDELLDRAWEIARQIAMRPPIATRNTRHLLVQNLKRAVLNELDHGLQAELWAQRQFFPFGAGMQGLDRPWDQKPWSD